MNKKKVIIALMVSSLLFTGCSSSGGGYSYDDATNVATADMVGGADYGESTYAYDDATEASAEKSLDASNTTQKEFGDKLVYTCNMSMETLVYDDTVDEVKKKIVESNGIIQSEEEYDDDYNWYYSDYEKTNATRNIMFTVRVPSEKYDSFLESLEGSGKIVSKSSSVDNISKQYYDTESIIKSLEIQEDRLLTMMEEAETIQDMISVETRLTEVQTELNRYHTSLASMQTDVDYSTVYISIREVYEYSPDIHTNTFLERLGNAFSDSWSGFKNAIEGVLFFVIIAVPQLVIYVPFIGIIVFGIVKFVKFIKGRKNG